jgi:predicted dehydrogenase
MKVTVFGLGSMGKRRIRLIKENFPEVVVYGIDTSEERQREAKKMFGIQIYDSLKQIMNNQMIDAAFVCTSPLTHSKIILNLLSKGIHVFTELNLVNDGYKEIIEFEREKRTICFLSSTMLYRKEIEFIIRSINEINEQKMYRYHVGQYLPDWHPWENYTNFFVDDVKTNGCRELLAIELPWIIKAFGEIENIFVQKGRITNLKLNYSDAYIVVLTHKGGHKGVLNIDVVSREAIRDLEIYSENLHIFWKGTPDSLQKYNIDTKQRDKIDLYEDVQHNENYGNTIIENAYLDEIKEFFHKITDPNLIPKYSFRDDLYTIKIMDRIEGNPI